MSTFVRVSIVFLVSKLLKVEVFPRPLQVKNSKSLYSDEIKYKVSNFDFKHLFIK